MTTSSLPQFPSAVCAAAVVISGFLCGCASSAQFSVEAKKQPAQAVDATSYRLGAGPALRASEQSGALATQVLRDVRTALSAHGLYEARAGVSPDVEIEVELGRGAPREEVRAFSAPVFAEGSQPVSRSGEQRQSGASPGPIPRKIGEREITRMVTVHPKQLRLTARAFRPDPGRDGGQPAVLWSIVVTSEDESPDLAAYSRLMVAAAMDWIGRSTGAPAEIALSHRDRRVQFLAQGTSHAPHVAVGTSAAVGGARADG